MRFACLERKEDLLGFSWRGMCIGDPAPLPVAAHTGGRVAWILRNARALKLLLQVAEDIDLESWDVHHRLNRSIAKWARIYYSRSSRLSGRTTAMPWLDDLEATLRINGKQARHLLLSSACEYYTAALTVYARYEPSSGFAFTRESDSLVAMMFCQFFDWLDAGKRDGVCERCGRPFQRHRSDKRFCHDGCGAVLRSRKYRRAKRVKSD